MPSFRSGFGTAPQTGAVSSLLCSSYRGERNVFQSGGRSGQMGRPLTGIKRDFQSPQSLRVSLPDSLVRMKDSKVYGTSVSLGRAISRVDFSLCPGYDLFIYFASSSMNSAAYEGRYRRESHATRAQRPKGLPS